MSVGRRNISFNEMHTDIHIANEPGAKLARPYYDNFVRHVVEAIHRGEPMASVAADGTHHLITESPRGVKIIMPNGFDVNQYAEQGMIYEMAQERDIQEVVIGPVCTMSSFAKPWPKVPEDLVC